MIPFSTVILTLNEESNLAECLSSLSGCDDIVVIDSGSTDRTIEIAKSKGARVVSNPFANFAQQRNFANRAAGLRHEWVFHLDADETLTPKLFQECSEQDLSDRFDGAWVAPRMMWRNRWLKRCTDYPAWQARFIHRDRFNFIEVGHGQREAPDMRMTKLKANYLHDLSAGGVEDWLDKHRRYAFAEAANHRKTSPPPILDLCSDDALKRRRVLKFLSYRLPCRPALRLLYQYILRGGFLDGTGAWEYCQLLARYEGFTSEAMRSQKLEVDA